MTSAFDRALEQRELMAATEAYALRYGTPGSAGQRAARRRFLLRGRTVPESHGNGSEPDDLDWRVLRILNAAIHRAMQIDAAPMANAQLYDSASRSLRIVAQYGFSAEFLDYFEVVSDTASACGSALAKACPVWVHDTKRSNIFAGTPSLEVMLDAGSRAVASLPVSSTGGQVMGVVSIHHHRPASWTRQRALQLERVADSAGRLLERVADGSST